MQVPSGAYRPGTEQLLQVWSQQLFGFVQQQGHGDPAVLAQLPQLRSAPNPRPAWIVFRANDLGATLPGRDGWDVSGLLLGRIDPARVPWYLFVVGAVERTDGQPTALTDVRLVALSLAQDQLAWRSSDADAQALQRYAAAHDPARVPRFPAEADRFVLVPCAPAVCVEEQTSGARWRLN